MVSSHIASILKKRENTGRFVLAKWEVRAGGEQMNLITVKL